jgi:serine/threonine protein kinase
VQWRAPKVLRGERPSFESDMFSFGMSIYQAVSGQRPWGRIPQARVKEHVQENQLPRRLSVFTDGQWELIKRLCCFEASERLLPTEVVPILRQIVEWNSLLDAMFVS